MATCLSARHTVCRHGVLKGQDAIVVYPDCKGKGVRGTTRRWAYKRVSRYTPVSRDFPKNRKGWPAGNATGPYEQSVAGGKLLLELSMRKTLAPHSFKPQSSRLKDQGSRKGTQVFLTSPSHTYHRTWLCRSSRHLKAQRGT